jgi:hypothetical protein
LPKIKNYSNSIKLVVEGNRCLPNIPKEFQVDGEPEGIISKLDYVKSLGIDAVWLNPIYASQMMTMDMTSATIKSCPILELCKILIFY